MYSLKAALSRYLWQGCERMAKEYDGLDRIIQRMDELEGVDELESAIGKACALVEAAAKKKAPKGDTGDLRRSIKSKVVNKVGSLEGIVYSELYYAPYVEYGTGQQAERQGRADWVGMPPQPYLRPALYENQDNITRLLEGALKK